MVYKKKIFLRRNGPFWFQKWHILIRIGSNFTEWNELTGTWKFISCFSGKNFIWSNLIFLVFRPFFTVWFGMVKIEPSHWSLNSRDMISFMITTGSLNSQDMVRILKQWRHDFSDKHLCGGYCMDIMWCLCVEVKIHGFVKLL